MAFVSTYLQGGVWTRAYTSGYLPPQLIAEWLAGQNAPFNPAVLRVDPFDGVSADGLQLFWLAPTQPGCLPANGNFLNVPAGNQAGQGDANGALPWERFQCGLPPVFPRINPGGLLRKPFSVIDTNAAHHFTLAIANYALNVLAPNLPLQPGAPAARRRVIVNFDAHDDIGTGGAMIACDRWGRYAVRPPAGSTLANVADLYAVLGVKFVPTPALPAGFLVPRNQNKSNLRPASWGDAVNQMMAAAGATATNQVDLYVSIDRDVMQSSYTTYGDGAYTPQAIRAGVQAFLQAWNGARVVGMDVVGLPATGGSGIVQPDWSLQQQMAQAAADISSFYTSAIPYG